MYKIGENEMVFCPYNRYHIVSKLRIQKHIIKCKKNYPDVKLATCFYNYTHRLKAEDMLEHYEICSQKTRIDGSRYSENYCLPSSNCSIKSDPVTEKFPDINVKPRVFSELDKFSSTSSKTPVDVRESDFQSLEFESDISQTVDDSNSEDDLEPLPLPKTISKAFVLMNWTPNNVTSEGCRTKTFGRAKSFCSFIPSKPTSASDLKPNLNAAEITSKSQNEVPVFFQKGGNKSILSSAIEYHAALPSRVLENDSSASITSSMFDDISTLMSEEISDEESTNEENDNDGFIFSNFDNYVRI